MINKLKVRAKQPNWRGTWKGKGWDKKRASCYPFLIQSRKTEV